MQTKKNKIELTIPSDNSFVSIARLAASSLTNKLGFNIEEIDDIKIAVSEACKHIIKNTKSENIIVEFYFDNDIIEMEIKDTEEKFVNSEIPELEEDYTEHLEMYILKNIMDDFKLKRNEKNSIIYMKKDIIKE